MSAVSNGLLLLNQALFLNLVTCWVVWKLFLRTLIISQADRGGLVRDLGQ